MSLFILFIRLHSFFERLSKPVLVIILFSAFSTTAIIGQPIELKKIELITDKQGLSSNHVADVLQDKQGYLWIATDDGLNRYDGSSFKTFRRIEGDTTSIQCNLILDIAIDHEQNIWYASAEGRFGYYDQARQKFVNFTGARHGLPRMEWSRIFVDSKDRVWIGFWRKGLYLFDKHKKRFDHVGDLNKIDSAFYHLNNNQSTNLNSIADLCEGKNGELWLGTYDGLYTFNPDNSQFEAFRQSWPPVGEYKKDAFMCIYQDSTGIWLGSFLAGATHYNPKTKEWKNYMYAEWGRPRNTIRGFLRKSETELWITTDDRGWGVLNTKTGKFFFPDLKMPGFPAYEIIKDYSGVIWIASEAGLFKYTPSDNLVFEKVTVAGNHEKFGVSEFYHDVQNHKLYYGTVYADGLHIRDEKSGKERVLRGEEKDLEEEGKGRGINIHDIKLDHMDTLWVVSESVVYILDRKTERLVKRFEPPPGMGEGRVAFFKITRSRTGDIWIATWRGGLFRFNNKSKQLIQYRDKDGFESVTGLEEDNFGRMWIVNGSLDKKGLSMFSYENEKFIHFNLNSDPAVIITDIAKAPNGDIWLSTQESGLFRCKASSPSIEFEQWNIQDGLPSDVINTVTVDANGTVWGTTPSVLFSLDPSRRSIRSFPVYSDLKDMSIYADADNTIFLETYGGFYKYDPKRDTLKTPPPKLVINSIKVLDRDILPLPDSKSESTLELDYNENMVAFEYVLLDFKEPSKNQYFYKLDKIDQDWVSAGNRRQVAYANLPPGHYNFMLKAVNAEGIWAEREINVGLTINPPFWERWYFKVFIVVLTVLIFLVIYRIRAAKKEAVAKIREKISRDLHDDMGSNVSTINILSNVAKNELSKQDQGIRVKEVLEKISNISSQVMESMDEIVWSLNPHHDSFEELIARMRVLGTHLLEDQGTNFEFQVTGDPATFELGIERRSDLYLIYKEAITNILKYAKCKNVYVTLSINEAGVRLMVTDDGVGFKPENKSDGNGLQNMKKRSQNLKAKLKIESQLNKGTRIELDIAAR